MKTLFCFVASIAITLLFSTNAATRQSQAEMNQDACGKYKKADDAMNRIYRKIITEAKGDAQFIAKMKKAQRAWLAFRDAQLEATYPDPAPHAYGSVNPMCRCMVLEQLTYERTEQLRPWADGVPEGDVCAGSVKTKQ